jgi:hypothetical protein
VPYCLDIKSPNIDISCCYSYLKKLLTRTHTERVSPLEGVEENAERLEVGEGLPLWRFQITGMECSCLFRSITALCGRKSFGRSLK